MFGSVAGVGFDVFAQLEVDVEALCDAGVEHAEPGGGGFLELGSGEQVAGLDDDLEGVGEVVGQFSDFEGEVLGDDFGGGSWMGRMGVSILGIWLCHIGHEGILGVLLVAKRWVSDLRTITLTKVYVRRSGIDS